MFPEKNTRKSATTPTGSKEKDKGFSKEELAAMKERAQELKAAARMDKDKAAGESALLAKIAEMKEPERSLAERLHALIKASVPQLSPKTWYGMPAYTRDDKVVCFFQSGQKFGSRYATLGFSDAATLDQGSFWPTAYALKELTAEVESRIIALLMQAVG